MHDCMKLCIARDQCTHTAELLGLLSFYIDYTHMAGVCSLHTTHTWLVCVVFMFHEDFKQYSLAVQWFWCFSHITNNYHQIKSCPQTIPPSSLGLSHHLCAKAHQMFGMLTLIYCDPATLLSLFTCTCSPMFKACARLPSLVFSYH